MLYYLFSSLHFFLTCELNSLSVWLAFWKIIMPTTTTTATALTKATYMHAWIHFKKNSNNGLPCLLIIMLHLPTSIFFLSPYHTTYHNDKLSQTSPIQPKKTWSIVVPGRRCNLQLKKKTFSLFALLSLSLSQITKKWQVMPCQTKPNHKQKDTVERNTRKSKVKKWE